MDLNVKEKLSLSGAMRGPHMTSHYSSADLIVKR